MKFGARGWHNRNVIHSTSDTFYGRILFLLYVLKLLAADDNEWKLQRGKSAWWKVVGG